MSKIENKIFNVLECDQNLLKESGLVVIKPNIFKDSRGYFFESFNKARYDESIGNIDFIQDNESMSSKGVLRGLHYQFGKYAQSKLVRVINGIVIDFALDIRKSSKTFGYLFFIELNEDNKYQFFIPRGFAHGFICLKDNTIFSYKCDNYWNKESERGIDILSYINLIKLTKIIEFKDIQNFIMSEKDQHYNNILLTNDLFK